MDEDLLFQEEDTQKDKYLTFLIEEETYAIDVKYIVEIVLIQPITKVPDKPSYVKGIINLRGKIVPILDVRIRFNREPLIYNDMNCSIIIVDVEEEVLGLIVDQVSDVLIIPKEDIVAPPEISSENNRFVRGIGKNGDRVKQMLDCVKLIKEDEIKLNEEIDNL